MNLIVPGGAGYIGARLVPFLLADGHKVTVFDTLWFGDGSLPDNPNLTIIKGDIRDQQALRDASAGQDACIYLASISNNAMYAVNREVTHAVNAEHFPAAHGCIVLSGVKRFIYASSVAVLDPTSEYAKDKLFCESILKDTGAIIVRAASVCGYSPHQRLDTTINMMTHDAYRKGVITVNGGEQERTHVHIDDLCRFYRMALTEGVDGETYTVWALSEKIKHTAANVAQVFRDAGKQVSVEIKPRSDNRSYSIERTNSLDWGPKKAVWDGVRDLIIKFDSGYWPDSRTNPIYQNINNAL